MAEREDDRDSGGIAQTVSKIVDELADAQRRGNDDRVDDKLAQLEGAIKGARSVINDQQTEEIHPSQGAKIPEGLQLCYIDSPWAWFTSLPLEDQWGDDWDDAPYQSNAGKPYSEEGVTHVKVAFDGPLHPPGEGPRTRYDGIDSAGAHGKFVAVEDMNRGDDRVPWLVETEYGEMYGEAGVKIYAGVSVEEFIDAVENAGGGVYYKVGEAWSGSDSNE